MTGQISVGAVDFYPRSPCGERRCVNSGTQADPEISIHALLAESDANQTNLPSENQYFYPRSPCGERPRTMITTTCIARFLSTLSLRRATHRPCVPLVGRAISIHALLAESDADTLTDDVSTCGFLSTLSLRRATASSRAEQQEQHISIHALLAESDLNEHCE